MGQTALYNCLHRQPLPAACAAAAARSACVTAPSTALSEPLSSDSPGTLPSPLPQVLVKRYGFDPEAHAAYIARILQRFKNPYLLDEVMRVGRDPLRKLDVSDRLIKPLLGTLEYGTPHDNLCKGIGAAMRYANPGDPQAVKLQEMMAQFGPRGTLAHIIPLVDKKIDSETMQRILNEYDTAKVKEATSG